MMLRLREEFEKRFGLPMDILALPEKPLQPFSGSLEDALLFGSASALASPILIQGQLPSFPKFCPEGYCLIGFWGHGSNSYSFYYSLVDAWRRVYFRLHTGGLYSDERQCARKAADFLRRYHELEKAVIGKAALLVVVDSIGEGYCKLLLRDGRQWRVETALSRQATIKTALPGLLTG